MSWAFITAIKQNPRQSYVELLNSIRDVLETKYTQKPQLSCSHPLGRSRQTLGPMHANIDCRYQYLVRDVKVSWMEKTLFRNASFRMPGGTQNMAKQNNGGQRLSMRGCISIIDDFTMQLISLFMQFLSEVVSFAAPRLLQRVTWKMLIECGPAREPTYITFTQSW